MTKGTSRQHEQKQRIEPREEKEEEQEEEPQPQPQPQPRPQSSIIHGGCIVKIPLSKYHSEKCRLIRIDWISHHMLA